jgi:hypothetical protein
MLQNTPQKFSETFQTQLDIFSIDEVATLMANTTYWES